MIFINSDNYVRQNYTCICVFRKSYIKNKRINIKLKEYCKLHLAFITEKVYRKVGSFKSGVKQFSHLFERQDVVWKGLRVL